MNGGSDPYKPYDFLKEYNENFINFSYKVMINIYVICYIHVTYIVILTIYIY